MASAWIAAAARKTTGSSPLAAALQTASGLPANLNAAGLLSTLLRRRLDPSFAR